MFARVAASAAMRVAGARAAPAVRLAAAAAVRPQALSVARRLPVAATQPLVRTFAAAAADVEQRVLDVIRAFDRVDPSQVTIKAKFVEDLGLDSLDAVELVMAFEDEFGLEIPDADADNIASAADAVKYIVKKLQ